MALADLLVLLLLAGAGLFAFTRGRRAAGGQDSGIPAAPETLRMAEEIRELRARIHVLERALTDHHATAGLSDEIERLRDR